MHSLYEIETTVKRSAKSQGLSWGISEEIGKSIRILEQSGLQGLESFKNIVDFVSIFYFIRKSGYRGFM